MSSVELKKFCGLVSAFEVDRFRAAFPQYGAVQWFMEAALKAFNDRIEAHPRSVDEVDAAIRKMLQGEGRDTATSINSAGTSEPKAQ